MPKYFLDKLTLRTTADEIAFQKKDAMIYYKICKKDDDR